MSSDDLAVLLAGRPRAAAAAAARSTAAPRSSSSRHIPFQLPPTRPATATNINNNAAGSSTRRRVDLALSRLDHHDPPTAAAATATAHPLTSQPTPRSHAASAAIATPSLRDRLCTARTQPPLTLLDWSPCFPDDTHSATPATPVAPRQPRPLLAASTTTTTTTTRSTVTAKPTRQTATTPTSLSHALFPRPTTTTHTPHTPSKSALARALLAPYQNDDSDPPVPSLDADEHPPDQSEFAFTLPPAVSVFGFEAYENAFVTEEDLRRAAEKMKKEAAAAAVAATTAAAVVPTDWRENDGAAADVVERLLRGLGRWEEVCGGMVGGLEEDDEREDDGKEDAEMGTGTVFADVILIVDQTSLGFGTLSCELNPPSTEAFNVRWTGELYGPPDAAERRDQAGENLGDDNHNHRDVGLAAKVASRGGGGRAPVRSCRLRWAEGDIGRVVAPRDAAASYDDAATASDMSAIAKAGFLVRDGVLVQFGFASSDSAKRFADALTSALSTVACNVVEGDSEGEDGDDDLDSNDIDDDGHDDQDSRAGDLAAVLARLDEEEQAELRRVKERFSAMRADKEREHAERVVAAAAAAEAEARREKKRGRGRRRRRNAPLDTTAAAAERESGDEPRECLVCCDDPEEFQIKPCGHRLCGSCAAHIYWNEDAAPRDAWKCPWDRGVVQDIVAIRGMSRDGGEDPR